jgi:hypothetical protein
MPYVPIRIVAMLLIRRHQPKPNTSPVHLEQLQSPRQVRRHTDNHDSSGTGFAGNSRNYPPHRWS